MGPTIVVNYFWNRIGIHIRRSSKYISDQGLAPSANLYINGKSKIRTPIPVERILTVLPEPIPLNSIINIIDASAQIDFIGISAAIEKLSCTKQTLHHVGGLDNISAIILCTERNCGPC